MDNEMKTDVKENSMELEKEKVLNEIRKLYRLNGYDFVKPVRIKDLVLYTELSENQILKIIKELDVKGYLVALWFKDQNGCRFSLTDLGKEKLLYT